LEEHSPSTTLNHEVIFWELNGAFLILTLAGLKFELALKGQGHYLHDETAGPLLRYYTSGTPALDPWGPLVLRKRFSLEKRKKGT
jgi:hypothetical protein